ncbi:MAG: Nif3-like dinuclear metal center hexameric protein [Bacillus subtilis]|nr:Nif3-like dinuclear metal center hexameric protein [Bacillus subtilis]
MGNGEVSKVMLALSPTLEVIEQAIENNCGLIIAHHPLIFSKINKININNLTNSAIIKAIQNNVQKDVQPTQTLTLFKGAWLIKWLNY